uniref:ATP synthase subunit a n=1 Tax=Psilotreta sp. XG-2021 TaxID=2996739 RepID=A0A9E8LPA3_9NEOP|nr:ATP synthase F0 subunit 6 [Psilotreta sp. XG-2021]
MMTNLFSIFDPTTNILNLSLNWLSTLMIFFIAPVSFWLTPSRFLTFYNKIIFTLHNEFKMLMNLNLFKGSTLIFISLFTLIIFNNFLGLYPYIFTSSSHMVMNLSLSLPLWFSFIIFGWWNNTTNMLAHLIPMGTPQALMSFMVLIETISIIIRPGTLAIRLMANMIAGHLLMTLMSSTAINLNNLILMILLTSQILLITLESAVAVIQAYVFSILSTLYSNESN